MMIRPIPGIARTVVLTTLLLAPSQSAWSAVAAVSAGSVHSLFLKTDGTVWGCGDNSHGELGFGTESTGGPLGAHKVPKQSLADVQNSTGIPKMAGIQAISAGASHTLILDNAGDVWALGSNQSGQFGNGSTTGGSLPVKVMSGVKAISAGNGYSLFLQEGGTVMAAGGNAAGRLGDGTTTQRLSPVQVLTGVSVIEAGSTHSLFIKTDGSAWACGDNYQGGLGDGTTTNRATPKQVLTGVKAVSSGDEFSLFLKTDGSVWAAGTNWKGQLGNSGTSMQKTPIQVMTGIQAIEASVDHSFFLKTNGDVLGCGYNYYGALGSGGGSGGGTPLPSPTLIISGVRAMSSSYYQSLFLKTDGAVWACGANFDGELGDNSYIQRYNPVQSVINLDTVIAPQIELGPYSQTVVDGDAASFTVSASGGLPMSYQWWKDGQEIEGATEQTLRIDASHTGDEGSYHCVISNSAESVISSAATLTVIATRPTGPRAVAAGWMFSLFLDENGTAWATGSNEGGQLGIGSTDDASRPIPVMNGVATIVAGDDRSFFIRTDGTAWAAGSNQRGELGIGATTFSPAPGKVLLSDVCGAACGYEYSLFVKTDGTVWGSGRNDRGQLGDGTTTHRYKPTQTKISDVKAVAAGSGWSFFLKLDGSVWASGTNWGGFLGDGTYTDRHEPVHIMDDVAEISSSGGHTMLLKTDGSVWALGDRRGFGRGTFASNPYPVLVAHDVRSVSTSHERTLYVRNDGVAWGCGLESEDQLDGNSPEMLWPAPLAGSMSAASVGVSHRLYLKTDGTFWASGENDYGALGSGSGNSFGTLIPVLLKAKPRITSQPAARKAIEGTNVTFKVTAVGSGGLTYQWKRNGAIIPNATGTSYTITTAAKADEGTYSCVIKNPEGSTTSSGALLTVNPPAPEIAIEQPVGSNLASDTSKKSFGTVKVGSSGPAKTFTIRNKGSAKLTGISVRKSGKNPGDFLVTKPLKTALAPGESTTFKVSFKPGATATRSASLRVTSNDSDESPFTVNLAGTGAAK